MAVIHPDVRNTLLYADAVHDHLLSTIEKMRALAAEGISEDKDIAVKVDMNGQLADLWLKPGILDRKTAAEIAKEITRLVTTAGQQNADQVAELFRTAHELPDFDALVAAHGSGDTTEPVPETQADRLRV
ncbi:hypothetical protein HG717_32205 [Rhodococcus erythropolis]|uniref:hypothetical protein n=1 Tax=Rhodococcus erythropolis TaxID=1833 RepID=UPI001C9B95DE|nr:hypothetical protein [Rhodococcus erythropolis]MBY6388547.1 hypothetical protein [Rhodococcus erythropolis]